MYSIWQTGSVQKKQLKLDQNLSWYELDTGFCVSKEWRKKKTTINHQFTLFWNIINKNRTHWLCSNDVLCEILLLVNFKYIFQKRIQAKVKITKTKKQNKTCLKILQQKFEDQTGKKTAQHCPFKTESMHTINTTMPFTIYNCFFFTIVWKQEH